MVAMSNLKNKVLTAMGIIKYRIWFLTIIPVGIPLCAIIGLMYGCLLYTSDAADD